MLERACLSMRKLRAATSRNSGVGRRSTPGSVIGRPAAASSGCSAADWATAVLAI